MKKILVVMLITAMLFTLLSGMSVSASLGERLDLTGRVKVTASSVATSADAMVDGKIETYWHSAYTAEGGKVVDFDKPPITVDFEFNNTLSLSGIGYTPRQDNSSGYWLQFTVFASTDGVNFTEVCSIDNPYSTTDSAERIFEFGKSVTAKFLRVVISNSSRYSMAAEIAFFAGVGGSSSVKIPVQNVKTTTTADTSPSGGKIVLRMGSSSANANGVEGMVTAPYIAGGSTMVPLRYVVESLGGTYSEYGDDITVSYSGREYKLKKNSNYLEINGIRGFVAKPISVVGGTSMVSILFIRDIMGVKCEWNQVELAAVILK